MKFLYSILILIVTALVVACGKNPEPVPTPGPGPAPDTKTSFEVTGLKINIKGEMKPGAKVSLAEIKSAVLVAVKQLESK